MTYNTQQEQIRITAYGRRVQEMVQKAIGIADRQERNRCARTIVRIMADLRAEEKDEPDFEQKLWDHLAYISDYKLDIDYPMEITRVDKGGDKSHAMPYPMKNITHRQYGSLVEESLRRCAEMPDGEEKDVILGRIANQMKRDLFMWSPGLMNDSKIANDIERLSGGQLHLPEKFRFANPAEKTTQGRNLLFSQIRPGTGKKNKKK